MVGTTVDSAVERCRRDALLASRGPVYTVNGVHNTTTTTIVTNETFSHVGPGEVLAWDYELVYVKSATAATQTVDVIRGYFGSTPVQHSDLSIIEVAPRFPKAELLDALVHEISSWHRKLFRVTTIDLDVTAGKTHYSLSGLVGPVDGLLGVRLAPVEQSSDWWTWSWVGDRHARAQARLHRGETSSVDEVTLEFVRRPPSTTTARVTVAQPFDVEFVQGSNDLIDDIGLKLDWLDLLEVGMKWRCLTTTVIGRSDWRTSNVARAAEEVTPLDVVRTAGHLRDLRDQKLSDAMIALRGDWGWREW